jgi:hypothetical protein
MMLPTGAETNSATGNSPQDEQRSIEKRSQMEQQSVREINAHQARRPCPDEDESEELPIGLALYKVEVVQETEAGTYDGWEEDYLSRKFGLERWNGDRARLTDPQRAALNAEGERRDQENAKLIAARREFAVFLEARGAITMIGYENTAGELDYTGVTSFVVAPKDRKDDVRAIHEGGDFYVSSQTEVPPVELLVIARARRRPLSMSPLPGEEPVSFAMRANVVNLEADLKLWRMVGGSVSAFNRMRRTQTREPAKGAGPSFLAEGFIPRGMITLIVGSRKSGKSTLATQMAVTAASGGGTFCGFKIPPAACEGLAFLVCGEDNEHVFFERLSRMDGAGQASKLYALLGDPRPLAEIVAEIDRMPAVSLVVIDPARKYLIGDEDGSAAVDTFYSSLEALAQRKNCAVVVIHHPKKSGAFGSLAEVLQAARGSGVFLDRPRVLIAMMRRGAYTVIGIPLVNGQPQHNLMPGSMFEGEVALTRDPATMLHEPVNGSEPIRNAAVAGQPEASNVSLVVTVVRRLTKDDQRVTRTGKAGLYERKPPELAGMSRRQVATAVEAAVETRRLLDGPNGLAVP